MSAMNGKNFKYQLRNAAIKLQRAVSSDDNIDPQSGYSTSEIVDFIIELPDLGNDEQMSQARATLRRNGLATKAAELVF